jgi:hypothetical protein
VARDPRVIAMISEWNGGNAFSALAKKAVDSASAVGMIYTHERTADMFLRGGMAMQRMWLSATLRNLSLQPMGAPVFMFAPVILNKNESLAPSTVERLTRLRPEFERTFNLAEGEKEVFIFRLLPASEPPARSLRKTVDEVLLYLGE